MLSYCLKCKKNTESIDPKVSKTTNGKIMILSKCAIYGSKKFSNLGIRRPLNKIPILGDISFKLSTIILDVI